MKWEDFRRSDNVEDRRGASFGGGGGMRGGLGIGGLIVVGLIAWATGINPAVLLGGAEILFGDGQQQGQQAPPPGTKTGAPSDQIGQFAATVLAQTEDVWVELFKAQGKTYEKPNMVLFSGATRSGCGNAQSAMGPFYCPQDQKVYLDLTFFEEMKTRFRAPGDFAAAYVIAHEVGHHVENQIGILARAQQQQKASPEQANAISVRIELMADCFAGVWAYHANERFRILEQGDVEEALNAASAIGDDTLQKRQQGQVVPDSFTHGSSAQRVSWFNRGLKNGSMQQCNTFQGAI